MCKLLKRRTLFKKKKIGSNYFFVVLHKGLWYFMEVKVSLFLDKTHNRRVSKHHNSRVEDLHLKREF